MNGPSKRVYDANHQRVRRARGPASEYTCVMCPNPAHDWATIHGTDGVSPYAYMPLCRRCHQKYDGVVEKRVTARKENVNVNISINS